MPAHRRWLAQGSAAVAVAAAIALFVFVNLAGAKFWTQFDWTRGRLYSLSGPTQDAVGKLDHDVRIVSFLVDRPELSADVLQQIRALLAAYQDLNPRRVRVESIDAVRDPLRAQTLLREFNLDPLRDSIDVVIVQSGARSKQVRLTDMVEFDAGGGFTGAPAVRSLKVESAITGAILSVTRERRPRVLFATGHGELGHGDSTDGGLSGVGEALTRQDIEVGTWDALGATAVPAGADAVIVAGPSTPWLPAERDALRTFLGAGGRALLLLDPVFQRGQPGALAATGLAPLLAEWGVTADDDIVIDPDRAVPFYGAETFYAPTLGLHPVTSSLGAQPILFSLARSLTVAATPPGGVVVNSLTETSANAWGETQLSRLPAVERDPADRTGVLPVAVAAERQPAAAGTGAAGRVVIVGDADFATNRSLDQLVNRSFVLNAVAWLVEETGPLGIEPKDRTLTKLFLTEQQVFALFTLLVVVLPVLTIGAGLAVWWRRRRG